jgi:hypothetical protein
MMVAISRDVYVEVDFRSMLGRDPRHMERGDLDRGTVTSIRDDCPVELVPLCTWPQVREILALKEQANVAGIETEAQEKLLGRQIEIVGELQDLGALRAVAEYLVRESSEIGNWGFALALSNLSAARALEIFKNVADPVPEGDAFDTVKLIELQLGFGTKSTARLAFDAHARYVSDKYGGFLAVFVMAEVGLALSQAGFSQPARAYFAQADDVARLLPTNGDPLKYPRMMSFLQLAQRTADAGFAKCARAFG